MERLVFWALSLGILCTALCLALEGRRRARRREIGSHRSLMRRAGLAIGLFLGLYAVKVIVLGHENLSDWSRAEVRILAVHKTIVVAMLLAGCVAAVSARRANATGGVLRPVTRVHRLAGRLAVACAAGGLLSSILVFVLLVRHAMPEGRASDTANRLPGQNRTTDFVR